MADHLNRCFVGFTSAYAHHFFHRSDKDFAVTDFAGASRRHDGVDTAIDIFRIDNNLNLDLGQKINHVFSAPVQLGMAFLTAETFDLSDGQASDAAFGKRFAHFFEFEGFDDGSDLFHGVSSL